MSYIKTLREYKEYGILHTMKNRVIIYDSELEEDDGSSWGTPLCLQYNIFFNAPFMDCDITNIGTDHTDSFSLAFYLDTKVMREKANVSDKDFIDIIIKERENLKNYLYSNEFIKITGYKVSKEMIEEIKTMQEFKRQIQK